MADSQKYYDCGKPTLIQGGWQRAGAGNAYVEFQASTTRISTLDFVPTGHPNNIKVTGIASKTLEVSALALRNDNYIIEAYGWQANGAEFNVGDSYDKLGIMFRFQDNSDITPSDVEVQELGEWKHSLRKLTTATEVVENPLYSDGTAITAYTIKGNTVQSGTPTPSVPISVQGVGNKTANLFNCNQTTGIIDNSYINKSTSEIVSNNQYYISYPIPVEVGETYIWRFNADGVALHTAPTIGFYNTNDELISVADHASNVAYFSFTVPNNCAYIKASVYKYSNKQTQAMLNVGNAPLDYEPYGFKIPISTAQGSAVNYLGSVQSNRQIKKLVLTGGADETWNNAGDGTMYRSDISDYLKEAIVTSVCTHYPCNANVPSSTAAQYGVSFITSSSYNCLYIKDTSYSTATDFKNWLATEYANGTPVTIWYVLATATTGTVNEPLHKIGDYSDSISNAAQIPTIDGANTITVDTTVQPSEVTATWTGWHDASVKEWDGSDWG